MKVNLGNLELDPVDRCAARRHYRILRIAIYAPQSYTGPDRPSCQGYYGLSREEAKQVIYDFYRDVGWHAYLGSK